jgi:hypothetical protein
VLDHRLKRCLEEGTSLLVGSVSAKGDPVCCRAVALTSHDDLATVTVYVPMATSAETIANVATTRRLAVVATQPADHCATQLKGIAQATRLAREDEAPMIQKQLWSFGNVLGVLGIPPRVTRCLVYWPAFAIDMRVEEIYDQTPGPKAGARLR